MSAGQSFYDVLNITPKTSDEEVKQAYRKLVKTCHPDFNPQNRRLAELKFKALNEAYTQLQTRERRIAYNQAMRIKAENDNRAQPPSLLAQLGHLFWPVRNKNSAGV